MSARGFLWRWNLRVLRNEWRQHFVIFALITSGVALSVGGLLAAYNLVEPPESQFGNANLIATSDNPDQLDEALRSSGYNYARVETASVQVSGSAQRLQARAFDQNADAVAPLVALVSGAWPIAADEIAVTNRAVIDAGKLASTLRFGASQFRVVGIVENPTRLNDEFVFLNSLDNIDLRQQLKVVEFYVEAEPDQMRFANVASLAVATSDGPPVRTAVTIVVSVVSALGMLEVALLVGAGFSVIARRRSRQFGLVAAAGATPSQIRASATTAGILIGLAGTTVGLVAGGLAGRLILPQMEKAVGHRISFEVPWAAVGFNAVLAILIAALASRWPTRSMSKAPVAELLSSLRPRVEPVARPAIAGIILAGAGATALGVGFAKLNTLLAVLGVLLAPIGLLLLAPVLVKSVGPLSTRLPLAARLGGRAIARHNRRSASVVAAIALALAIPVGVAVVTESIDARTVAIGPNLADTWMIGWQPGADDSTERIPADLDQDAVLLSIDRIEAGTDGLELFPLQAAVPRGARAESWNFDGVGTRQSIAPVMTGRQAAPDCLTCDTYGFGESDDQGNDVSYVVDESWIASPQLLKALGIDDSWLATGAQGISKTANYVLVSDTGVAVGAERMAVADSWPNNARVPPALINPGLLSSDRFDAVNIGLFATSDQPVTAETREAIRAIVGPDLVMEFQVLPDPQSGLRITGLLAGIMVGLGMAASAVGLFTVELGTDLAVLSSIGASPKTNRLLLASVAAILAGAGAALALMIGYLPLVPLLTAAEFDFPFVVPWLTLTGFAIVFPVLAAAAGWIVGRNLTHVQTAT